MPGRKTIALSIALLSLLCLTCGCHERVRRGGKAYAVVARLDAGTGRSITVLKDEEPFEVPAWYYEVDVDGQVAVPTTFLYNCCHGAGDSDFTTLYTRDGHVVGLVWDRRPEVLLMMHDFTTGENWPRGREP